VVCRHLFELKREVLSTRRRSKAWACLQPISAVATTRRASVGPIRGGANAAWESRNLGGTATQRHREARVDSDAKCNPVDSIGSSTESRVSHSEPRLLLGFQKGQRRLGEKEHRARSVTPGVALRVGIQAGCGVAPGMRGPSRSGRVMVRSLRAPFPAHRYSKSATPAHKLLGAHRRFWGRQAWHRQRPPGCENTGRRDWRLD
jgi:hypothetical protein